MKTRRHNGQTATPDPRALPPATAEERKHSDRLMRQMRDEIATSGGAIPFGRFMELALFAPGLGYYAAGQQKFGAPGDFITAPELGSLFARCIARQCRSLLAQVKRGDILEVGAGSGVLAADLLVELESLGGLPDHYLILEVSTELRHRQADTLQRQAPRLVQRVHWLDKLPDGFRGIVLANELLDAMPVERFRITENGVNQMYVAWDNDRFTWREQPADAPIRTRVEPLALPLNYTSEVNLRAEAWVRSIADILRQGVILLIDYGFPRPEFYHPQRAQGTLMCHYRHRAHDDPLILSGLQDVTAHVDFTGIAEAGIGAGLSLLGYTSQAAFLIGNDLEALTAASDPENVRAHLALTEQIKKLTLPHEMGELYKVITLGRGVQEPLPGFSAHDRRGRL